MPRSTSADLELHAGFGIPPALLVAAGVRRVSDAEARDLLCSNHRGTLEGILYPRVDPISGREVGYRVRRDHPELENDGHKNKYMSSRDRPQLYFLPGAGALLTDVSVPVVPIESEKAALAITAAADRAGRRVLPVGLGGCWSWRGRIGRTRDTNGAPVDEVGPLPDLHRIVWADREAIILFDARPNGAVLAARQQFARVLRSWGAVVKHAHLPDDDARVNGPDDLVREQGDNALWAVLDRAVPEDFTRDTRGTAHPERAREHPDRARQVCASGSCLTRSAVKSDSTTSTRMMCALDRLWLAIDDYVPLSPVEDTLHTVIVGAAHDAPVHPVRNYLDRLQWDGMPPARYLARHLRRARGPSKYVQAVGALVLIAAVRRVRHPGVQV